MKKLTLLFSAVLISSMSYAQFTMGPKIGISSSELKLKNNLDDIKEGNAQFGFHAGLFTRITFAGFYIQPEALFTSVSGQVETGEGSGGIKQVVDIEYNKLDVPLMFGIRSGKVFRIQAGPVANVLLSADAKSSTTNIGEDVKNSYNDLTIGYQAGFGLDLNKVTLDLKWEGNLSAFGNDLKMFGKTFQTDQRQRQLIFSIGYKLF